jgi:hypothetical protein
MERFPSSIYLLHTTQQCMLRCSSRCKLFATTAHRDRRWDYCICRVLPLRVPASVSEGFSSRRPSQGVDVPLGKLVLRGFNEFSFASTVCFIGLIWSSRYRYRWLRFECGSVVFYVPSYVCSSSTSCLQLLVFSSLGSSSLLCFRAILLPDQPPTSKSQATDMCEIRRASNTSKIQVLQQASTDLQIDSTSKTIIV